LNDKLIQQWSGRSKTSRWAETRGLTNCHTSATACSPQNSAANGEH